MQLFLENSIEIMGLLMQKITNLIICVLYNCNFLISLGRLLLAVLGTSADADLTIKYVGSQPTVIGAAQRDRFKVSNNNNTISKN